jgi:hypothetical protein
MKQASSTSPAVSQPDHHCHRPRCQCGEEIETNIETVLSESYPNATFTIEDAGSKMEAAMASHRTLTMLLFAMATIVFIVAGSGL